jgi:virulence-associated protein VagC
VSVRVQDSNYIPLTVRVGDAGVHIEQGKDRLVISPATIPHLVRAMVQQMTPSQVLELRQAASSKPSQIPPHSRPSR